MFVTFFCVWKQPQEFINAAKKMYAHEKIVRVHMHGDICSILRMSAENPKLRIKPIQFKELLIR